MSTNFKTVSIMNNKELLEWICGYLPYRLKILAPDGKTINNVNGIVGNMFEFHDNGIETFGSFKRKLILRPLSDLTKPCLEGGKVPIVELAKIAFPHLEWNLDCGIAESNTNVWFAFNNNSFFMDGTITNSIPNQIQLFQWLYRNHFDIHGLIGKNYAIDINTLK